ncbi:MAG: helix-turn-helix domain-containing protein [Alistipes sp.]|nr:helix-turn-helix domain-containing protein [Alistipes sp.]MCD7970493.1 helix-turn-helix domain-containing protein [Alistipes sp.]
MRTETDKVIIENVKCLRKKLKISQRQLAVIIDTSYSFVAMVENPNSHQKYSAHHLFLIAEDFDCDFSELFPPVNKK